MMTRKLIDLTQTVKQSSPTWDGKCGFRSEMKQKDEIKGGGVQFCVQTLSMDAGIGTHIDAPAHCIAHGQTVSEIPLDQLVAPGVMIDVSQSDENTKIGINDIRNFEEKYGIIPEDAFVIFNTGWSQFWDLPARYHNNHRFPSISADACEFLLNMRNIVGLGIDTLSPDTPDSGYPVHQLMLNAGRYIVENVANANMLPPVGFEVFVMPMKGENLTEAPVRLIAVQTSDYKDSKQYMTKLLDPLSNNEKKTSERMHELLFAKKVFATNIHRNVLYIQFEDGTRLYVDDVKDSDISIT